MNNVQLKLILEKPNKDLLEILFEQESGLKDYLIETYETENIQDIDIEYILYEVGSYFYEIGENKNAINIFEYLIHYYFNSGNTFAEYHFSSLNFTGLSFHILGDFDKALEGFEKAEKILKYNYHSDWYFKKKELELKLLNNKVDTLLEKGEVKKAITLYNKTLKKLNKNDQNDHDLLTQTLLGRANAFRNSGKFSSAIKDYNQAKTFASEQKNYRSQARAYHGLGNVYEEINQLRFSLSNYYKSLCFYKKANDHNGILEGYIHVGNGLHSIGLEGIPSHQGYVLNNRAIAYLKKAKEYYLRAIIEAGEDDIINKLDAQIKIASLLGDLKNYDEAEEIYQKVQGYEVFHSNYWLQNQTFLGLANIYDFTNRKKEAIKSLNKAKNLTQLYGTPEHESQCDAILGLIFKNEGQLKQAKKHFKLSINTIEELGLNLDQEGNKISYYGKNVETYREMIHSCLLDKDYSQAFHFLERSKMKALRDLLSKNIGNDIEQRIANFYGSFSYKEVLGSL